MGMAWLYLPAVFLVGCFHAAATESDVTPRLTFSYNAKERTTRSFSLSGVFNFTSLLLSKEDNTLYVGTREILFALNLTDLSAIKLQRYLTWKTPERKRDECSFKGKNLQTDCFNYIRILLCMNSTHLYVCGTYAFSPTCAYIGDMGGERVLQKKWTTFLKAQLLCTRRTWPDDGFPFNIIQDMFVLTPSPEDWKNSVFYGVFTSQWYNGASGSSAVCSFTMDQVEKAFNGRYREVNRETQQW